MSPLTSHAHHQPAMRPGEASPVYHSECACWEMPPTPPSPAFPATEEAQAYAELLGADHKHGDQRGVCDAVTDGCGSAGGSHKPTHGFHSTRVAGKARQVVHHGG